MKPEIIIGIVAGIGTETEHLINELNLNLRSFKYEPRTIKISSLFTNISEITRKKSSRSKLKNEKNKIKKESDYLKKMHLKIDFGDFIRRKTNDNAILSYLAIYDIFTKRTLKVKPQDKEIGHVYIIDQLKTVEEYKALRKVYGRSFILIGAYEDEKKKKLNLEIKNNKSILDKKVQEDIDNLIERDKNEYVSHGQNVENLFPESHLFVDVGNIDDLKIQIKRFVNILFDYPYHTPTKDEIMMFLAKGLASRSADLGRQVGAVIGDDEGNIIAIGCNDVPKFGGGQYWENDIPDLRDFKIGYDSNIKFLLKDIKESFKQVYDYCDKQHPELDLDEKFNNEFSSQNNIKKFKKHIKSHKKEFDDFQNLLKHTRIAKHLEFGRCIHAEEAAICDAARRGISLKDTILYCTTYPCHLCVKHILGVGIKRVVYIDPYPKSKAKDLFDFSISITEREGTIGKLIFEPFKGIAPRRFFHSFLKRKSNSRKNEDGSLITWPEEKNLMPTCFLKNRTALSYIIREFIFINKLKKLITLKQETDRKEIQSLKKDIRKILQKYTDWKDEEIFE